MSEISRDRFLELSARIVGVLLAQTTHMSEEETVRHIYNMAIQDATEYVGVMANENSQYRLPFTALKEKMERELPLIVNADAGEEERTR